MFVLRNAWIQLTRHHWRTLSSALIALIVAFGMLFGLAVGQARDTAVSNRSLLGPDSVVRMSADKLAERDGADPDWTKNYLTLDDYNDFYRVVLSDSITLGGLSASASVPVRQTDGSAKAIAGSDDQNADKTGGEFTLKAFTSVDTARKNELGRYKVVKGKHLSYSGSAPKGALISQALADENGLKVGDEITVAAPSDKSKTVTFVVRGIYEYVDDDAPAGYGSDAKLAKDNRDNAIYVAYATFDESGMSDSSGSGWSIPDLSYEFDFSSMDDYKTYKKDVAEKIPDGYEMTSPAIEDYEQGIVPIKALASRTDVATPILLAVGAVALLALALAGVARRRGEIGFALASGVTRGRIGWQFALEGMIPVAAGGVVGLLAAIVGVKPLAAAFAPEYAAVPAASMIWRLVWILVGTLVVLALATGLRPAFVSPASLFAARDGWNADDDAASDADASAETDAAAAADDADGESAADPTDDGEARA
ncbi:ABC transporter permease [Bifidobacterium samirii]|uniref:ABC transporter permease n=1 Tax=Bifidobacterium samirii TaxID=2306974 RepID=A0A430FWC8_9BIFI|nr:ABC transporter permease [Bifidobacterium samirii]RSX58496.1 ABC transporter permease [Bifidobacterium samirii]